jgi:hypothetical protein
VRGFFTNAGLNVLNDNGKDFRVLVGSKMLLGGAEVRMPLTGPERLSLIRSRTFFTELALFLDGGLAWDEFSELRHPESNEWFSATAAPVFSAGASLRINLFGALILEPYYAIPLMKETRGIIGLNFTPGW